MGRLGVIGGHGVLDVAVGALARGAPRLRRVPVPGGPVDLVDAGDWVFLQRHRQPDHRPAPFLDHHAHAHALAVAGCDRVLALGSCGGLRADLVPGTSLVPADVVALAAQPDSRFRDERALRVPGFDPGWRARVCTAWNRHATPPARDGGVYVQTVGPRFETPAEVRGLAACADVVGMTVGSELVACAERDLAYAAVVTVDNLANGIAAAPLTMDEFDAGRRASATVLADLLRRVLPELAA